jgi:hypothetical protein
MRKTRYILLIIKALAIPLLMNQIANSQMKYEIPAKKIVLEKSLEIGLREVGTLERTNRNDGNVRKYLQPFGLPEGSPYCAAGIYFTFLKAVEELRLTEKDIPIAKTALANQVYLNARKQGHKVKLVPMRHDLLVWRKARTKFGHIERIYEVEGKGWVRTLAFNVKNDYGQEGVFLKRRNILHPLGRLALRGLVGFKETQ